MKKSFNLKSGVQGSSNAAAQSGTGVTRSTKVAPAGKLSSDYDSMAIVGDGQGVIQGTSVNRYSVTVPGNQSPTGLSQPQKNTKIFGDNVSSASGLDYAVTTPKRKK
jgi:hypothetical protein